MSLTLVHFVIFISSLLHIWIKMVIFNKILYYTPGCSKNHGNIWFVFHLDLHSDRWRLTWIKKIFWKGKRGMKGSTSTLHEINTEECQVLICGNYAFHNHNGRSTLDKVRKCGQHRGRKGIHLENEIMTNDENITRITRTWVHTYMHSISNTATHVYAYVCSVYL